MRKDTGGGMRAKEEVLRNTKYAEQILRKKKMRNMKCRSSITNYQQVLEETFRNTT